MERTGYSKIVRIVALLFGLMLIVSHVEAGKLYKWVDENGVVHYSDRMPPETVMREHEELDDRGINRQTVDRAKTEEELQIEQMEKTLEEQQRKIHAEEQARQRLLDQNLLRTFTTERDLIITRDERLNVIDSTINLYVAKNNAIVKQIEAIKERIARIESSGREIPENVSKELANLNEQYETNKGYIEQKQNERDKWAETFESDLIRFRQLKGINPEGEPHTDATAENTQDDIGNNEPGTENENKQQNKAANNIANRKADGN